MEIYESWIHEIGNTHSDYLFNMEDNSWKSWNGFLFENIDFNDIPKPSGHYGGIGSRELTEEAAKQIKMLYEV